MSYFDFSGQMRMLSINNAEMPDKRGISFINRAIVVKNFRSGDKYCLNAQSVCDNALGLNIYFVDETTMDSMSESIRKGHTLGDSEFDYDLPEILFPRKKECCKFESEYPDDYPIDKSPSWANSQEKIDENGMVKKLKSITKCVSKNWDDAVNKNPELKEMLVKTDFLGFYYSKGPINRYKNINAPEIWICYSKIKRECQFQVFEDVDASPEECALFRTVGVILHELGHAVMDDGRNEMTIPYSLYSSVEEPLADKIMLDYLYKVISRHDYRDLKPVYKYNRECVEKHSIKCYSIGSILHKFERTAECGLFLYDAWKDAKWFLYTKRECLEEWQNLDFRDKERCSNLFSNITKRPFGYAKDVCNINPNAIVSNVAIRSIIGLDDVKSQADYIQKHFERILHEDSTAQMLYVASDNKVAVEFYLALSKKYEGVIQFNGKISFEGLSLDSAFFEKNHKSRDIKFIVLTSDAVEKYKASTNIKAVYIGSPQTSLESVSGLLKIDVKRCKTCLISFCYIFYYLSIQHPNYVIQNQGCDLAEELKKNMKRLDFSAKRLGKECLLEVDGQEFINNFSKMQGYLCIEIKAIMKAFIAIYKVYALTEVEIDSEIKSYYDWCDSVITSIGTTAVENHIVCLK